MLNITLRPLCNDDIALVDSWLRVEHAKPWFESPEDWLFEFNNRYGDFAFITHFIAESAGCPIGFCQYYDCYDGQKYEDWYKVSNPGELFSIDYLIGDPAYLGQGYGKEMVRLLTDAIQRIPSAKAILVQPDARNLASCGVLFANGYVFDEKDSICLLDLEKRMVKQHE